MTPEEPMGPYRGEVCKIVSAMLDNPDEHGIYPTSKAYAALDALIARAVAEATKPLVEAGLACVEAVRMGAEVYQESLAKWEWLCADPKCRRPTRVKDKVTEHTSRCRVAALERALVAAARGEEERDGCL